MLRFALSLLIDGPGGPVCRSFGGGLVGDSEDRVARSVPTRPVRPITTDRRVERSAIILRGVNLRPFLARVRAALPSGWAPFPGGEGGALASALTTAVADLDYRYLNDQLPVPTDENLARSVSYTHLTLPTSDLV